MHINIRCLNRHSDIHQHIINSGDQLLEAGYILLLYVRLYAYPWCITIRTYPGSTIFLDGERGNLTALQIFRIIGCKAMQMHRIIGVLYVRIHLALIFIMGMVLI